uniref:Uncharacterized protein n=1 Tax=Odontella aurita TaxID=265563 RepID=A0A7S4M797_9STRA|mmetsp:Transcript_12793/g.37612  ORF Transcript_12793/g.37612 Transcript_12793/m.37612 type:complete len:577 (+) Transcript_12793:119-1849(+)
MPARSFSRGASSLGDDGATIDSADDFDMSLLCTGGGALPKGSCGALLSSPETISRVANGNEDGTASTTSTASDGQHASVAQHVELKMRNAELQSSHDLLTHAHRLKEEECNALRVEVSEITEERDAAFSRVKELRKVLRQFKKNATEFSLQRARMRVEVERLQEESDRMKRNRKQTVEERDDLRKNLDALLSSLDHLKSTTEQLTKERDDLREQLKSNEISKTASAIAKGSSEECYHQGSWIERSFRLPAHLLLHEIEGKSKSLDYNGGETPLTSCSRLSCDMGEDETIEGRRNMPKTQGWLSFRWNQGDENKNNNIGKPSEDIDQNDDGSCGAASAEEDLTACEISRIESKSKEALGKLDGMESGAGTDIGSLVVADDKQCNRKDETTTERGTLRRAVSWAPESSHLASASGKRMSYRRSQSTKETRGSVRNLFSKESRCMDNEDDDRCVILGEGAFESAATPTSSQEVFTGDRRFVWPFGHGKENEKDTGEVGDADEGDCNAIIPRKPSLAKKKNGREADEDRVGKIGPLSLWRRPMADHAKAEVTTRETQQVTILRRKSNGDLLIGSTVAIST